LGWKQSLFVIRAAHRAQAKRPPSGVERQRVERIDSEQYCDNGDDLDRMSPS
jgi:hypothetical protein